MTRQHASTRKVQAADLASKRKPPAGTSDVERADALLRLASARVVSLPERVVVPAMLNGHAVARPLAGWWWRPPSWEAGLYVEWAHRERRRELALFAGLIG